MPKLIPKRPHLYPHPRSLHMSSGSVALKGRTWISVPDGLSERLRRAIVRWRDRMAAVLSASVELTHGAPAPDTLLLRIRPLSRNLGGQAYRIRCAPDGVELEGGDEAGLHHALQTLGQLLTEYGLRPPGCRIEDAPDLPVRGFMLDVSRCKVPTLDTLFEIVERLARLKVNQLQLYTEHTFAFVNHAGVWRDASPLTAADVTELDRFCRDRFIELVPNLNSFGHFERWLRHPEYRHLAECPDGFDHPLGGRIPFGSTLSPTRESLALLRELFAEFLPNFSSAQFNIGCDETWELGRGRSRRRCARTGTAAVYLDFVRKVIDLAERNGRRALMWGDILLKDPGSMAGIPGDTTLLGWGYEADHPFPGECRQLAASGHPYYVCPGTSSWNAITGRTLNARDNLARAARSAIRNQATGYLITDWGDHGHHQYAPVSYAPLLLGASYAWCYRANRDCDPVDGVNRVFIGDARSRIGSVVWQMGRLEQVLGAFVPNGTWFNRLLFWNMSARSANAPALELPRVERCEREIERLVQALERDPAETREAELSRDELRNALAMARHALDRYLLYRGHTRRYKRAARELRGIIAAHERLWLARNRPGGLNESRARLELSLAPLE